MRVDRLAKRQRGPFIARPRRAVRRAGIEDRAPFRLAGFVRGAAENGRSQRLRLRQEPSCRRFRGFVQRQQMVPVRPQRQRIAERRKDSTAPRQIERPIKLCRNRRHFVRERRSAEAGMELARDAAPARALAALDHEHAKPGLRQKRRRGQTFRARADDDRVVAHPSPSPTHYRRARLGAGLTHADFGLRRIALKEKGGNGLLLPFPPLVNPRGDYSAKF